MSGEGEGVELAVRLVRQAVAQDSKHNYPEAARCYREAILILQDLKQEPGSGPCGQPLLQTFLSTKLGQYEERLRIIEQHLLSNSDLTQFFKELQSCHFDDCVASSSVSSDSKHLYKNPQLIAALNLIRRGRRDDERRQYRAALTSYEAGLAQLLEVLSRGQLPAGQAETARVKCLLYHDRADTLRGYLESGGGGGAGGVAGAVLGHGRESCLSLDSECDSPVPSTDTEEALQMLEVRSCRSGASSAHCSTHSLDRVGVARGGGAAVATQSLHSLYPVCEIRHSGSSAASVHSCGLVQVPLASISRECSLSAASLASSGRLASVDKISVLDTSDTSDPGGQCPYQDGALEEEPELAVLRDSCCEDAKSVAGGSDSGYSDPSPDGTLRDSKSPAGSLALDTGHRSPFSDCLSEQDVPVAEAEEEEEVGLIEEEVRPHVIIVNESQQLLGAAPPSPAAPRQLGRQTRARFQNPATDILVSQLSQDQVLVCGDPETATDAAAAQPKMKAGPGVRHPARKEVTIAAVPDVYTPRRRGHAREYIPPRAVAREPRGEHGDMNRGCYYVMAALDFCWCL